MDFESWEHVTFLILWFFLFFNWHLKFGANTFGRFLSRSDHSIPSISTIFQSWIPQNSNIFKVSKPKIPEFKILLMEMLGKRAGTCQLSHFVATLNPGAFCVINNNFIWSVYWRNSTGTQFFVVAFWSHAFLTNLSRYEAFLMFFHFLVPEKQTKTLVGAPCCPLAAATPHPKLQMLIFEISNLKLLKMLIFEVSSDRKWWIWMG